MGLRLQETCCSSQVLKLWRLDQETSEEELFIKARQISRQNPFYRNLMLKLDRSLTKSESTETYEIRISKSDFRPMLKYLCRISFLTTLDIYIYIYIKLILKAAILGMHIENIWKSDRVPYSLCKKLLRLCALGFCNQVLINLHCWWSKELCSQQRLLQVARVSHVLGFVQRS